MELPEFIVNNRRAVMMTYRKDGSLQSSIVTSVADKEAGQILIWARGATAKAHNLARNPHASLCVVRENWSGWVHVDATVEVFRLPEAMPMLEHYYRLREGKEHANWEEYRKTMNTENRVLLRLTPERMVVPPGTR